MKRTIDQSYGIIPLRRDRTGDYEVLLVAQYRKNGNGYFWGFPKGHAEPGESDQSAAVRELHEETGYSVRALAAQSFLQTYSFIHDGMTVDKTVTYWIALVAANQDEVDTNEIKEGRWVPLQDARSLLTHENTKLVLGEVIAYLKHGDLEELFDIDIEQ